MLRLLRDVQQVGHLPLHLEGELVGGDDPFQAVRRAGFGEEVPVHRLDEVDLLPLERRDLLGLQILEEPGVVDPRPLVVGREEGAPVVDRPAEVRRRIDGDVAREVLVLGPQAV